MVKLFVTRAGRVSLFALFCCFSISTAHAAGVLVPAGADLQAAINAALPGDQLLLAPGAVYTGNFRLPVKAGTEFITIRTESPLLPGPGVRVTPANAGELAKIKSPNASPALATADGAHHWRIENVEFLPTAGGAGDIIALGSGTQTEVAQLPHDLVFDRVYIHGDPIAGQKRGIALNSGYTEIINSYIADIKTINADSPCQCAPAVIAAITAAAAARGLGAAALISRAYHDALFMSRVAPAGMIFIPCRGGVSHRPDEYASPEAIAHGVGVLADTLAVLAG